MATQNRAGLINRLLKVVRKHYKPVPPPPKERTLFEHLAYACLVENSPFELAEQVFKTLQESYFDWNEVRVSTIRELTEVTKPLVDSSEAAARLKSTLHSVFEGVYQFDLETLKKQNIGQSSKQLEKLNGSTPFVVAYVTQMALGGHSIPINRGLLLTMHVVGVISDAEFKAGTVPGLERVVPKTKGVEVATLLHQLGVEIGRNPYGPNARKLLLEIDPKCKDRLPKRKAPEPPAPPPASAPVAAKGKAAAKDVKETKDDKKKPAAKAAPAPAPAPAKKDKDKVAKEAAAKKKPTTKPTKRPTKPGSKPPAKKKATTTKLTKRKPK
jgi:endonuclease III